MAAAGVQIKLLGAPGISRDGQDVDFDTRKAVALIAFLVVTGRSHRRDALGALLWPEYDGPRARAALRRTLSTVRKGIGASSLVVDRSTISLSMDDVEADVVTFRALLDDVEAHDHGPGPCRACLPRLERAVALYRGDLLDGFGLRDSPEFDTWQSFEAETLRRRAGWSLELLGRWSLDRGRPAEAVRYSRRWVAMDPLHESAHRLLMTAFWRAGDRAAAVRQYRECVRILGEELGVDPLAETTSLYEAIAAGEEAPGGAIPDTTTSAVSVSRAQLPLIGRVGQLSAAHSAYEAAVRGAVLAIEGEAGVGKSRLAAELVDSLPSSATSIVVSGHAGESDLAYAIVADVLRSAVKLVPDQGMEPRARAEIARLVPELSIQGDPAVPALDQPGARMAFFETIGAVLASALRGDRTGVLVFDDLQWADEASIDVISFLARRVSRLRALMVLMWRREELGPAGRLPALMADLRREHLGEEIRLERLDRDSVYELAARAGIDDPAIARRLYEETEGLPFFVVEYLGQGVDPGATLPAGVRDLLTTRLSRTTETARQILTAAAVVGGPFDLDLLRDVSGRTEQETVEAIDGLVALGLFRSDGDQGGYTFGHDKMRELVYDESGPARRRSLHRRAAAAIRTRMRRIEPGPLNAVLARHLEAAGADHDAALAYRAAADHARRLFANEDALRLYDAALALEGGAAADLHEAIGDVQTLVGDYSAAVMSYERAVASSAPDAWAEIEAKIAQVHQRGGRWDLAEMHHRVAFEAADPADAGTRSRIAADRSLTARRRGDVDGARRLAEEALTLAGGSADAEALARVTNMLGVIELAEGNIERAIEHLEESLGAAGTITDPSARIAALNNLASAHRAAGELDRALAYATEALDLCTQLGDRHRQAALHSNIADLLHATGHRDEAIIHLKEAAALFTTVGDAAVEPEIWKLVEW